MLQTVLSRSAVRELDQRAIQEYGVPSVVLMENAGRGAAELLIKHNPDRKPVTICCGPGNNGGDGFVIARHLLNHNYPIQVWLIAPPKESGTYTPKLSQDCEVNYRIYVNSQGQLNTIDTSYSDLRAWQMKQISEEITLNEGWIVDALFGTGLDRALQYPFDEIVAAINASQRPVLAIDIPSGLDCDTGMPLGPTVRAKHTATFVAWKQGFVYEAAKAWIGDVTVLDIGAPKHLVQQYLSKES